MVKVGIDIGSVSVNYVMLDEDGNIIEDRYVRHKGKPFEVARDLLKGSLNSHRIKFISTTGVGAKEFSELIGASFVNEIVAISRAFFKYYPEVRSIIDIGGEDSKFILLENGKIKDFSMNALCAAGTGSFLDQQASRLRFTIEEFGEIALRAKNIPRIAGRCTVFAKSDMIHLQQIATPDYEIVAGLCYALARNFKGNIVKGKELRPPCAFIGGVAANVGMRKALKDVFSLNDEEFFVPEHFTSMGALGAIYKVLEEPSLKKDFCGLDRLETFLKEEKETPSNEPLEISERNLYVSYELKPVNKKKKFYLGVDVGSISTNLALIDEDKNVVAKRYLMTEGRPLEAVRRGLKEIWEEVGDIEIAGCGTTGSGRYLTADFIGADIVRNEITAQAEAAINIDPEVDTIFEIGGQDSKYISIDNGVIVDFEMNKSCAAGTGSFLEEQAERLGISIKEEFGKLALSSKKPVKMGERCTVFIESDVFHYQQKGSDVKDIAAGLAYSIVLNYLNKVVGDKRIGKRIFFQGGTAFNKAVIAAFEKVLKRPIIVPPHHDVTGAIGVAILAMKEKTWEKSGFKGFDLSKRKYAIETFECKGCENLCEIRKVTIENEAPLYYGSRCEKYDVIRRTEKKDIEDLFKFRSDLLNTIYEAQPHGEPIGIPRILYMHEFLPFFKAFLSELGFSVVFSDPTNKRIIKDGVETIIVESCFPVKLAHGHIVNLIEKGLKKLFIPSIINIKTQYKYAPNAFACPYTQSIPYTSKASIDFEAKGVIVESPVIYFGFGTEVLLKNLISFGKSIGKSKKEVKNAFEVAHKVQEEFYKRLKEKGEEFLNGVTDENVMVLVGRPYNSSDPGANLNIHKKLIDLGVKSVPMDMIPLPFVEAEEPHLDHMYWGYGQKILNAARFVKANRNFYAIYISNFGCGPDSFIGHFFKRVMGKKPYLQLEIDEHSADAGIVTRLEAFLDSIKNAKDEEREIKKSVYISLDRKKRTVLIPYMSDHSFPFASAFKACGVDAEVMDESDEETLFWGRKFTTGRECYPCILTTGDMVKCVRKKDFDPERFAFFMPSGGGPCRFGQYHRFHRMVLDELGFENVPIYAPNQDHRLYKELEILGGKFSRLGWWAIVATDLLIKMLHHIRPYEEKKGLTDAVYRESLKKVSDVIKEEKIERVVEVLKNCINEFLNVKVSKEERPIIGIVGEIYIRSNRFSNENVVRKVEEFGGEAFLAPITEWVNYINYMGRKKSIKYGDMKEILRIFLTSFIQKRDEKKLERIFNGYMSYCEEPDIKETLEKAHPYIHESFEGEAILTIGKSIEFIDMGASGIINTMPFTCMPGTISSAIMKLVQDRYNVPVINIAYDGQGSANILTRLEAFMHQVRENFRR